MQTPVQERYQQTMIRVANQKWKGQRNMRKKRTLRLLAWLLIIFGVWLLTPLLAEVIR